MDSDLVTSEVNEGVATVTINRPPLNVLHIPLLQRLESTLTSLSENDEIRVLLLRAEGKFFSAGVDVADHTADKVDEMIPLFNRVCSLLYEFPVPTLAIVRGHALGGGCELVLCCDLAYMAEEAKLGQPEIQLAAIAPVAALRLTQLVGYRASADLLFTGRTLSASEALEFGLVNGVLPQENLTAHVEERARHIAQLSRPALVLTKRALRIGAGNWEENIHAVEIIYLQELMKTADALEGVTAFLEKRPPVWKHK